MDFVAMLNKVLIKNGLYLEQINLLLILKYEIGRIKSQKKLDYIVLEFMILDIHVHLY